MGKTAIQWTAGDDGAEGYTWNPLAGCSHVSAGCDHCYAATLHNRRYLAYKRGTFPTAPQQYHQPFWGKGGGPQLIPERLEQPLHWRKPRRVFVDSVSDLFHEDVPDEYIDAVFAVMASSPEHTFQILTKRPARMRDWFRRVTAGGPAAVKSYLNGESMVRSREARRAIGWDEPPPPTPEMRFLYDSAVQVHDFGKRRKGGGWPLLGEHHWSRWPLPNVWIGVSVENQDAANERIPLLLDTPAAMRFLSMEPLLEEVNLAIASAPAGLSLTGLHWVIVGGESGPRARPMDLAWIDPILDQCRALGIAPFVKQLGQVWARQHHCKERHAGDPAEWPEPLRVREWPQTTAAREVVTV